MIGMFLNILIFRHILCRLKRDEKRNKYGSIPCKNGIYRKRTEKSHFYFRKYKNGIPQIQKHGWIKIEKGGTNGNISVRFQHTPRHLRLRGAPVPIDAGTVQSTPRSARQQQHTDSGQ